MVRIDKLVIVGVGLIGGSFALALKAAGAVGRVVGVGRGEANIARALDLKIFAAAGGADRHAPRGPPPGALRPPAEKTWRATGAR